MLWPRFYILVCLVGLSACGSFSRVETGSDILQDESQRIRDLESLLEGRFVAGKPNLEADACPGQRVEFSGSMIMITEIQYSKPNCGGTARGEITYTGRIEIGSLSVAEAGSRPMDVLVQEVRAKALQPGWGLNFWDNCGLRNLDVGESKSVTGQQCRALGPQVARFPAPGERYRTRIAINSGQRIRIENLPRFLQPAGIERAPASLPGAEARSNHSLEFERTQL